MIDITKYYTKEQWNSVLKLVKKTETPCQFIILDIIKEKYNELKSYLKYAKVYYAVKANPNIHVIKLLNMLGSNFDIASRYELDNVLYYGITPDKISYGNTIKKIKDIEYFYKKGVRLFVTDSYNDMNNISKYAPGSKIFCRILVDDLPLSDWPLTKKFGCSLDMAINLLKDAKLKGLIPYGISFHVGSQQKDITTWKLALLKVKYIFDKLKEYNIELSMVNIGGGVPAHYIDNISDLSIYYQEIDKYLHEIFDNKFPEVILEPGRSLVGNSGILVTEIINISIKEYNSNNKWLFIDTGKFGGLIETLDESIKYPIYSEKIEKEEEYIIAGQTCDSADILYEKFKYKLPSSLEIGDKLYILSTGAYTASYSSIEFNGFPPLKVRVI